jgi:hypothetical protein
MNYKYGVAIALYVWIITFISCTVTWKLAFKSGVRSGYYRGRSDGMKVGANNG